MAIQSGILKHKIKFIDNIYASDGVGGQIATQKEVLETWAEVKQISSAVVLEAMGHSLNTVLSFRIRKRSGFAPKTNYDLIYNGSTFNILQIENDEVERIYVKITAVKRDGQETV